MMMKEKQQNQIDRFSEQKIDMYGKALERWANIHHQKIFVNNIEILYFIPPTGGWGNCYWDYPYGNKGEVLENNRKKLRELFQKSSCDLIQFNYFFTRLCNESESYVKAISHEDLRKQLTCIGTTHFEAMEFSSD